MSDLAAFLGHFHPVWVHLPIGIFLLLGALELAGWAAGRRPGSRLPALAPGLRTFILALGAASAVAAAALGWLLARRGDYDVALVTQHQWLGFATAVASLVLLLLRRQPAYRAALPVFLVLLVAAAHWGGKLTHGSNYLVSSLPPAAARLFGVSPAAPPKRPVVVTFDQAVAFTDVVQPILQERCARCHGPTTSKGGLRLDSWDELAKGGKHGPVLKAGNPAASPLLRRIDLPADAKDHMPPKGKVQLTIDELTLLDWWVAAGAPRAARIAALDLPPAVEDLLEDRLGGDGPAGRGPDRDVTLHQAGLIAGRLGVLIRPLTPDGPWLEVNARIQGQAFGDRELAALAPIAAAVQSLDLGTTAVTDAGLAALAPMRRLERLHLDQTGVTDGGLDRLGSLKHIEYLNLRGTAVTDRGVASLRALPRLRSLYLWQSAASPAAVKALGDALVDQRRIERWQAQQLELGRLIQAEQFEGNTGESFRPPPKPAAAGAAHPTANEKKETP